MNKVKNIFSKYIIKIYLVALVYFLFIDYKYFGITSLIVFSIYSLNKTKLEKSYHAGLPPETGVKWLCNVWIRLNKIPEKYQ